SPRRTPPPATARRAARSRRGRAGWARANAPASAAPAACAGRRRPRLRRARRSRRRRGGAPWASSTMHGRVSEGGVSRRSGPERRSSWPMWVLGLVIMIDQVDQNIVRGVATPLKDHFHLSDLQLGILLSSFIALNGLVRVPAGYLADRWNRTLTSG